MKGETEALRVAMNEIKTEFCGIDPAGADEEEKEDIIQIFPEHDDLSSRVCKTLYYGRLPSTDRPSLPLTQLAVEQYAEVGLTKLARLDMSRASDMSRDAYAGPTSLVLSLIYLDRLKKQNPDYLQTVSSADLFLVSMMVASKFLHDDGEEDEVFNDEWAKSGNIDLKEFNRLEIEFLSAIDWRVNVPTEDFQSALYRIEQEIAYREMSRRGWASYSDLVVLSQNPAVDKLWRLLTETSVKLTSVCMAAYAASVLTFLGTAALLNQTPFGPTSVAQSLEILRRVDRMTDTVAAADTPVPEPSDRSTPDILQVSPAELLTASLLVTSLSSGADFVTDDDEDNRTDFGERVNWTDSYGSVSTNENNGSRLQEIEPPDWLVERSGFIHHATSPSPFKAGLADYKDKLLGLMDLEEEMVSRVSKLWSESVWRDFMSDHRTSAPTQKCPILRWGSTALFHPQQLSILV